jgi:hypothetical protein
VGGGLGEVLEADAQQLDHGHEAGIVVVLRWVAVDDLEVYESVERTAQ